MMAVGVFVLLVAFATTQASIVGAPENLKENSPEFDAIIEKSLERLHAITECADAVVGEPTSPTTQIVAGTIYKWYAPIIRSNRNCLGGVGLYQFSYWSRVWLAPPESTIVKAARISEVLDSEKKPQISAEYSL